jgi:hypothetical protein
MDGLSCLISPWNIDLGEEMYRKLKIKFLLGNPVSLLTSYFLPYNQLIRKI